MSKKYEGLAQQNIEKVGGKANVIDVYHCQTRLRFKLVDDSKADQAGLEKLNGVAKVLINAGVFQVVIGTHVAEVFEEIEKLADVKPDMATEKTEKKGIITSVIDFVAGTFQPIIPALSGAGMVKAVLALLVVFNVITTESQTYYLLNLFADGVFFFLPMLLAFTEAQKLKCNPILAVGVAAMMMHPNWTSLVSAGEPVYFFGVIPFTLATYTSSVIPIILIVFVQSYVEKYLNRWIPKSVNLVFVPMCTFLIMGTLAFSLLGPIGSVLGGYLAAFFEFLSVNASWAPAVLIGGFLPIMVMFGLHNGVAPLGVMQMSNLGYDSIFGPGCVCSNMAQATAGFVVALRTRDKNTRQTAASGFGGLYAGLTHTHRFATGSSGLPAVLLYIGDDTMSYFINIIIALIISIAVTAVLTFILSLKFEKKDPTDREDKQTLKEEVIMAPVDGEVLPLAKADDEVFASKALGEGVVIEPSSGSVVAPFDGKVVTLFPTKHAIGLVSPNGAEVLIHIGVNTVELNGKYFESFVKQGDEVKAGQPMVTFDPQSIKKAGYSAQVMVLVTNTAAYQNISVLHEGNTRSKEQLLKLEQQ